VRHYPRLAAGMRKAPIDCINTVGNRAQL